MLTLLSRQREKLGQPIFTPGKGKGQKVVPGYIMATRITSSSLTEVTCALDLVDSFP